MNKKQKIANTILYIVSGTILLFGLMWLFATKLLYYQQVFLGTSYDQVNSQVTALFLILYKSIGANYIAVGVTLALLTRGQFSQGEPWTRKTILVLILLFAIPFTYGALRVGSPTFLVPITMVLGVIVSLVITRSPKSQI